MSLLRTVSMNLPTNLPTFIESERRKKGSCK